MTTVATLKGNPAVEVVTAGHLTQGTGMNGEENTSGVKECECSSGYCAREMGVPLRDSRCRTHGVMVDHHQVHAPSDADASKDRP